MKLVNKMPSPVSVTVFFLDKPIYYEKHTT